MLRCALCTPSIQHSVPSKYLLAINLLTFLICDKLLFREIIMIIRMKFEHLETHSNEKTVTNYKSF